MGAKRTPNLQIGSLRNDPVDVESESSNYVEDRDGVSPAYPPFNHHHKSYEGAFHM